MIKTTRNTRIDTIFVLIIFCVFAISVLMVLMLGANIYKNMTDISHEGYDDRTGLSYIWTKVKNNDKNGTISIGDFNGLPALCFDEVINDDMFGPTSYRTMVYYYNGWVCELFSETSLTFLPEDGEQIIKIDDLSFEALDHGVIKVTSGINSLLISPRSVSAQLNPAYADHFEGGMPG